MKSRSKDLIHIKQVILLCRSYHEGRFPLLDILEKIHYYLL